MLRWMLRRLNSIYLKEQAKASLNEIILTFHKKFGKIKISKLLTLYSTYNGL